MNSSFATSSRPPLLTLAVVATLTLAYTAAAELFVEEEFRYKISGSTIDGKGSFSDGDGVVHTGTGFNEPASTGIANNANTSGVENLWQGFTPAGAGDHDWQGLAPGAKTYGDLTRTDGGVLRGGQMRRNPNTAASSAYRAFESGTQNDVTQVGVPIFMATMFDANAFLGNFTFGLSSGNLDSGGNTPLFDAATVGNFFGFRTFNAGGSVTLEGYRARSDGASSNFSQRSGIGNSLAFATDERTLLIAEYNFGASGDSISLTKITEADADLATANGGLTYDDLSGFTTITFSLNFNQNDLTGVAAFDNSGTGLQQFLIGDSLADVAPGLFTVVPEPTTFALAGLGALSMLLIRRRK